jgi:hypothetical protein
MLSAIFHLEYANILRLVSHWQAAFFFVKGSFVKMTEKGTLICEYQQKFSKYLILI